ncbi:MAG: response regulator [Candidatus Pseudobacter hemicellulosilyticus]|uniref:Response regulator n=1 Tax=Candidatus Pseudobacter hemicellulosilyticus TaxID=3121375 RepID=A0AAJ6BI99_9BACT|nr:MAG: response regulator [Pseudobacter sp.]
MTRSFLLTDDDSDDRELFAEALMAIDPSIVCHFAEDGESALLLLESKRIAQPDMIFLDINMPGMNGWQLLKKLKASESLKNLPVVMYSTSSSTQDKETARDLGALCLITKPYNFKLVRNVLEIVVDSLERNALAELCVDIHQVLKV